jgi:hypothetical protein
LFIVLSLSEIFSFPAIRRNTEMVRMTEIVDGSVADPDPGSGAFLPLVPGSKMQKNQIQDPQITSRILFSRPY